MGYVIAIDLGATRTRAAVIEGNGRQETRIERRTPHGENDSLIGFLSGLIREMRGSLKSEGPTGIGLSVAGPVDINRGMLLNPPNMPFRNVPLTSTLSRGISLPVRMVNDCHAGLLGELTYGRAENEQNVVYITISTGIGGGVLANDRIILGRSGNAAEIGHLYVDNTYALPCGCGNISHWEGYASGRSLPRFFSKWCHRHGKHLAGAVWSKRYFYTGQRGR